MFLFSFQFHKACKALAREKIQYQKLNKSKFKYEINIMQEGIKRSFITILIIFYFIIQLIKHLKENLLFKNELNEGN